MTAEIHVERPREEVARYAMDWRNDTEWIGALSRVELVSEEPLQVRRVAGFLGKRIEYVNEVVELVPARRLAMRSVKAPFPMTVVYEFEDAGDGTLMRIRTSGDATGFYRVAGPLLARAVRRGVESDLARLKRRLED
ncbi:MAG: SRPBCC family protein [Actinomycetota bacterium]|nr:SRPBCC family protein [Actinomycetota bacterium]